MITSLRPPAEVVKAAHSYGGIVMHDVISVRHAEKALEQGVDGLILVCAGAGGHAGTLSPFALVSEVRRFYQGTIALSGAIANGRSILAAQRSEEHTSELQSLMRISYAVFCLKKNNKSKHT